MNTVTHILKTADNTINQRASDRDVEQERSMASTVNAFNAIFGTNLTEAQGWSFMVILKIKRGATGGYREDDFIDQAAYTALAAEARSEEVNNANYKAMEKLLGNPKTSKTSKAPEAPEVLVHEYPRA